MMMHDHTNEGADGKTRRQEGVHVSAQQREWAVDRLYIVLFLMLICNDDGERRFRSASGKQAHLHHVFLPSVSAPRFLLLPLALPLCGWKVSPLPPRAALSLMHQRVAWSRRRPVLARGGCGGDSFLLPLLKTVRRSHRCQRHSSKVEPPRCSSRWRAALWGGFRARAAGRWRG